MGRMVHGILGCQKNSQKMNVPCEPTGRSWGWAPLVNGKDVGWEVQCQHQVGQDSVLL